MATSHRNFVHFDFLMRPDLAFNRTVSGGVPWRQWHGRLP